MNPPPQFTVGQEVVTPKNGSGVVKWVYPAPPQKKRTRYHTRYAVAVRGRSNGLVLYEQEIKPKPAQGPEVQCRGCGNHCGFVVKQSIRCFVSRQYRMVDKLRICKFFSPLQPAQGG